jgi:hypothetical protein
MAPALLDVDDIIAALSADPRLVLARRPEVLGLPLAQLAASTGLVSSACTPFRLSA